MNPAFNNPHLKGWWSLCGCGVQFSHHVVIYIGTDIKYDHTIATISNDSINQSTYHCTYNCEWKYEWLPLKWELARYNNLVTS